MFACAPALISRRPSVVVASSVVLPSTLRPSSSVFPSTERSPLKVAFLAVISSNTRSSAT